jgi:protein SCO1
MDRRILVLGAGALLLGGGAAWFATRETGVADVALINAKGETVQWRALNGQPRAVFFGFTHCPVICPVTVYELNDALDQIGATNVAIDFVSIDPERDTPQRLEQYFSEFGPRIRAFTGEPEAIAAIARHFDVTYVKQPGEGEAYNMDHTATVFLVDAQGKIVDVVAYGSPPDVMQTRLRALSGAAG